MKAVNFFLKDDFGVFSYTIPFLYFLFFLLIYMTKSVFLIAHFLFSLCLEKNMFIYVYNFMPFFISKNNKKYYNLNT